MAISSKMRNISCFGSNHHQHQHLSNSSCFKLPCFCKSTLFHLTSLSRYIVLHFLNTFFIYLLYFIFLSFLGFWILLVLKPRTLSFKPRNLDLFFTSVSATTIASMSTVEMEVFSDSQLIVLTVLMFAGGEVFTSMAGLYLSKFKKRRIWETQSVDPDRRINLSPSGPFNLSDHIELAMTTTATTTMMTMTNPDSEKIEPLEHHTQRLKHKSIKFLRSVVFGYLLIIHVAGVTSVLLYLNLVSSSRDVLKRKGLKQLTFSLFTVVSTVASCGFVPTNENMIVFVKNSGLLLVLIPQALLGNALFPPCLRLSIWVLGKFVKKEESEFLLKNSGEIGYLHLLPSLHSSMLVVTVFGFVFLQFLIFCALEWDSTSLSRLGSYQKVVGVLFQVVNARHTGETVVDLSTLSPAILVLFVVMMYLPPYTSFLPIKDDDKQISLQKRERKQKRRRRIMDDILFSQLSYLAIFIILVCITERKRMRDDPLNFNVLSIAVEVISAYGSVGFSTGYSCARQLNPDNNCQDKWYGFSGKWSDQGKLILLLVMLFGRLKKFNMDGGQAWKLM